jgi:CheY-like chemotaxis protein
MNSNATRVLVVDDCVDSTEVLALLIARRGHDVRVAHDVDEALRVASDFKPQVALLDLMIRCESGFFLAREMRALPDMEHCRLVAMTGFVREQHRQTSEAAGFHQHLNKPIDLTQLFEAIEAPRGGTGQPSRP